MGFCARLRAQANCVKLANQFEVGDASGDVDRFFHNTRGCHYFLTYNQGDCVGGSLLAESCCPSDLGRKYPVRNNFKSLKAKCFYRNLRKGSPEYIALRSQEEEARGSSTECCFDYNKERQVEEQGGLLNFCDEATFSGLCLKKITLARSALAAQQEDINIEGEDSTLSTGVIVAIVLLTLLFLLCGLLVALYYMGMLARCGLDPAAPSKDLYGQIYGQMYGEAPTADKLPSANPELCVSPPRPIPTRPR